MLELLGWGQKGSLWKRKPKDTTGQAHDLEHTILPSAKLSGLTRKTKCKSADWRIGTKRFSDIVAKEAMLMQRQGRVQLKH